MKSQILVLVILLVAVIATAISVVHTRHESRHLAVRLGQLEKQHDEGLAEWSRLQIEQAWLADASHVESKARNQLGMDQPAETQILVVDQ